jgi:hypothetical protein
VEEILGMILKGMLFILFILLIPAAYLVATPFILLWPGKRLVDGSRARRDIKGRYRRVWKILEGLGLGIT